MLLRQPTDIFNYLVTGFYIATSVLIMLAPVVSAGLLVVGRKPNDGLLIAFLVTLAVNVAWAIASPIAATMNFRIVVVGDIVSRLIAVAGYLCLLLFAIRRRKHS